MSSAFLMLKLAKPICGKVFNMKRHLKSVIVLASTLAILGSTAAQASWTCNEHGAVVTQSDGTVLYMGKNCDVVRKGGGSGYWFNAASFLAVVVGDQTYQVAVGSGIDCLPFCTSPD